MHLEDHLHQFTVYMKNRNKDFPDTLLQQFNFHPAVEDVPTTQEETSQEESESGDKDQPASQDSSLEEEKERGLEEVPQMVPPKRRQKHIIRDDNDESEEE